MRSKLVGLCFALSTAGGSRLSTAQEPSRSELLQKYGANYIYRIPSTKLGSAWTLRPWLGRKSTLAQTRRELETRFAKPGFDGEAEFTRARKASEAKAGDSNARFRWGYLGFLIAQRDAENGINRWGSPSADRVRGEIRWTLALAPDPADAEYDRLRFIYEAANGPVDLFRELGKRLVIRWPDDEAILRNQALNLANSSRMEDFKQAINITDGLIKRSPKRIRYIALKGDIYRTAWVTLHRREDGLATIEWTERYLRVAPTAAYNREALLRANDSLRKQLGVERRGE